MISAALFLDVALPCSQADGLGKDLGGIVSGVLGTVTGLVGKILQLVISLLEELLGTLIKPVPGIPITPQPDSPISLVITGIKILFADAVEGINRATNAPAQIEEIVRNALNETNPTEAIITKVTEILANIFEGRTNIVRKLTEVVGANLNALSSSLLQLTKLIQTLTNLNDRTLDELINRLKVFNTAMGGVFGGVASTVDSTNVTAISQEALQNLQPMVEKAVAGLTADNVEEVTAKLSKDLAALLDPAATLQDLQGLKESAIASLDSLNTTLMNTTLMNISEEYFHLDRPKVMDPHQQLVQSMHQHYCS